MAKQTSPIKRTILHRVNFLYFLFFLVGFGILARLIYVQYFSAEVTYNAARIHDRIFTSDTLPARRGAILARNGEPLATSIFNYQVLFDFGATGLDSVKTFHQQSDSLATLLAAYFGDRPAADYRRMFRERHARGYRLNRRGDTLIRRSDGWFARLIDRHWDEEFISQPLYDTLRNHVLVPVLPRKIDYAEWQTLKQYPLLNRNMGYVYHLEQSDCRIYPYGELARRTIGKVETGLKEFTNYGIEEGYREELAGTPGIARRQRIARGFSRRVAGETYREPVSGLDVVTTLDMVLQDVADRALREQLIAQNASWGTTIVMESRTGEILAMVNLGRTADGSYNERENYALSRTMEPGSTFKLASALTLLEDAGMSPDEEFQTNNGEKVNIGPAKNIQDSHYGDFNIALKRAIAGSSNVYFARAMWKYYGETGRKMQYSDFLHRRLHLGERVGLERLGERAPSVTTDWKVNDPGVMLVKMAYGYRVKLAPIHVITLYNAMANDGRMISPLLVKALQRDGEVVERFEARTIEPQICSRKTLDELRRDLFEVSISGTARHYFGDTTRYHVAAKTGTAEVTDGRSATQRIYLGSMVAFFPVENPRYTVLTSIETPLQAGKQHSGAALAGPVLQQVVSYIAARGSLEGLAEAGGYHPTDIKGGDIAQVRTVGKRWASKTSFESRKGWGRTEVDSLAHLRISDLDERLARVPDVRGMGLKDALFLLERCGLKVRIIGAGGVVRQSLAPGTAVKAGATVEIELK